MSVDDHAMVKTSSGSMSDPILVEVTRGAQVESVHRGAVAVLDADGGVVLALGDIDRPIFPRSAVKLFQALPLIESGAADRFRLTAEQLALAGASHGGEPGHVATAAAMLKTAGLDEECLECGAHMPMHRASADRLVAQARTPTPLHNNCSGKHAGFICLACEMGVDTAGYVATAHPVQREVRAAMENITSSRFSDDWAGIDGCSIPTYALGLRALALGFARAGSGHGLGIERAKAARRLLAAAAEAPWHVAGTGRFCTRTMEILGTRAYVKTGAEGVFCGTLPELGVGFALKCADGTTRASEVMAAAVIARLLPMQEVERKAFEPLLTPRMTNWNGIEVGMIRPSPAFPTGKEES